MKLINLISLIPVLDSTTSHPITLQRRDLAQDSSFNGRIGNGDYPRVTKLDDSTFLGTLGSTNIQAFHSSDGSSWTPSGRVVSGDAKTQDISNGFPYERPDGTYIVAYRNHGQDGDPNKVWRITISQYNGRQWTWLADPVVNKNNGVQNGNWEPFLRTAPDGKTIQLFYSHELNNNLQKNYMRTSSDNGKTWSDPITVCDPERDGEGNRRDGMIGVAQYDDNQHLIAVFESLNGDDTYIGSVESTDGGQTWGTRQHVLDPADGYKVGAPQIVKVGSNFIVSFFCNRDQGNFDYSNLEGRLIHRPTDGNSWDEGTMVTAAGASSPWNGLTAIDDSSFFYLSGDGSVSKWRTDS